MSLNSRGSLATNEYAQKRKEQMERARILREERKHGIVPGSNNALQGAGQEFVHRAGSNNSRQKQQTPIS